jgi:uncharacterized protein (DUF1015 family)
MVDVRPFRGWRYDPEVVGDLSSVLCPPYDLITPQLQSSLRRLSPYNVVHLEAGEGLDWDAPAQDQYSRTAAVFGEWTERGVLRRDLQTCLYLLRHRFLYGGLARVRLVLIAGVGLEEYATGQVLPHEYTEEPAIRDRVSLMEACNANFSPIMGLYRDRRLELTAVFGEVMGRPATLDVRDDMGQEYALWRITDPSLQESIGQFFSDKSIFLADGHHRYEAALRLRQKRSLGKPRASGVNAACNFVLMGLIAFEDPGLVVLPYHRVLGSLPPQLYAQIQERLHQLFEAQPMDWPPEGGADALVEQVAHQGRDRHALAMVGPERHAVHLLTLRQEVGWRQWGPLAVSEAWILEEKVLKPVLGDATLSHLGYIHDHQGAVDQVQSGTQQLAFLLKPFPMAQFESIVAQGHRLPRKSTFFYPKLPTGLVINQLDGAL